jgi:hypothetical protein
MLQITIAPPELYDERRDLFITMKPQTLQLEHSLVAISKWESKWEKPFISKDPKTTAETIDYIRCMTITQNVDPTVYKYLSNDNIDQVNAYIHAKMTATWFSENEKKQVNHRTITSELIYYWMIAYNIPFECQKWHLERLLTLIHVCKNESTPQKKMGKQELLNRNRELNAKRRAELNTKG